jgi:hypothetical protein
VRSVDSSAGLIRVDDQLLGDAVDSEFALKNIAIYWDTCVSASLVWLHHEHAHVDVSAEPTDVPIGLASFPSGFQAIRWFVDHDHKNMMSWHDFADGRHDAARQAPDVPVADPRGYGDLLAGSNDVWTRCGTAWFRHVRVGTTPRGVHRWAGVAAGTTCRVVVTFLCDLMIHVRWLTPSARWWSFGESG